MLISLRFNRYSSFILLILSMTVKFTNSVRSDSVGFMLIKCWYDRLLLYIGADLCIRVKLYIIRKIGNSMSLLTFEPPFTSIRFGVLHGAQNYDFILGFVFVFSKRIVNCYK